MERLLQHRHKNKINSYNVMRVKVNKRELDYKYEIMYSQFWSERVIFFAREGHFLVDGATTLHKGNYVGGHFCYK